LFGFLSAGHNSQLLDILIFATLKLNYRIKKAFSMETKLTDIQTILGNNHILTCFSGRFSQGLIEELGLAIKNYMESEACPKTVIYNVFSIYIEQTQNIKNYAFGKEGSSTGNRIANSANVCIGALDNSYFIWSGNLIEDTDVAPLQTKLDSLAERSKDELKELYKEQLKKDFQPGNQRAGLGLIDIARKASAPIEYSFHQIDPVFSFYEIKVVIEK
jgi:hypothetical protein